MEHLQGEPSQRDYICFTTMPHIHYCHALLESQAGLLVVNAAMILNRPRFLAKYGLDDLQKAHEAGPMHTQVAGLLHAVAYLKMPVIVCNALTIVFEILLGGT